MCFVFFLNNNKKLKFTFTSSRVVSLRVTQRKKEAIIMYNRQVILVEVKIIYREENVEGKLFCCFFFHVFESFIYVDYTRWTELREKNYKLISLSQLHFGWTITIMTIIPSSSHEAFVFFFVNGMSLRMKLLVRQEKDEQASFATRSSFIAVQSALRQR